MGAKTCLVAQVQGDARGILSGYPDMQESTTTNFVASLFPDARFGAPQATDLSHTYLSDKSVIAGCTPGLGIVVSAEVAMDRPSELPRKFIAEKGTTILHAMHSVVDWFAFAVWEDGVLIRSLSVAPDDGVIEDIGARLDFEKPYWDGLHPAVDPGEELDDYPLPFHPLELGEAALREFFGFQMEGFIDSTLLEPERIRMFRFEDPTVASATPRGDRTQTLFGTVAFGALMLPCFLGALTILRLPAEEAPSWLIGVGVVLLLAGFWIFAVCVRSVRHAAGR